jgi:hypothetical protein
MGDADLMQAPVYLSKAALSYLLLDKELAYGPRTRLSRALRRRILPRGHGFGRRVVEDRMGVEVVGSPGGLKG